MDMIRVNTVHKSLKKCTLKNSSSEVSIRVSTRRCVQQF